jgi:hypothetical protein
MMLPFVKNHDLIGIFHRAQAVSHDYYCAAMKKLVNCSMMIFSLLASRALVASSKKQVFRVFINCTGYEHPLFLTLAQSHTLLSYLCVQAQGQAVYIFFYVGHFHGLLQLIVPRNAVAHGNIAGNGIGENKPILHHHPALAAPGL